MSERPRGLDPSLSPDPDARAEDEIAAEIESHIEGTVELLMDRGMTEAEAKDEALRRFGDVRRHRNRLVRRDRGRRTRRRTMEWFGGLRTGFVESLRRLRRHPGFALAVVATLGLGIGANATIFGVIDRLLLRAPSGIEGPAGVRRVWVERREGPNEAPAPSRAMTWLDVEDLRSVDAFRTVAAWSNSNDVTLGEPPNTLRIQATIAEAELFTLLGARPRIGRFFTPDEDAPGAPGTAVLSWEFWQRRFGGDPGVLGEVLHIGDGTYEVVGVAEPGFTGLDLSKTDVWLPLFPGGAAEMGEDWPDSRGWWWLSAAVRMAPDAPDRVAEDQATAVHRAARADIGDYDTEARVLLAPVIDALGPRPSAEARVSRWLAGVALLVLIVACANVANLWLAQVLRRRGDLAVRVALGSSRRRMIAAFLAESAVLAALAGVVAVGLAVLGSRVLFPTLLPEVQPGPVAGVRLFAFTAGAAGLAALLAGLLPALRASRAAPAPILRSGNRSVAESRLRIREVLVIAQAALSAVLLVGAGLFLASLREAGAVDVGFDADRVVFVRVERDQSTAPLLALSQVDDESADTRSTAEIYAEVETALARLPGVESAARTVSMPFWLRFSLDIRVPGSDSTPRHPASGNPVVGAVAPGFFRTMGQDILRGREFTDADLGDGAAPAVVVNESFADFVFPTSDALGRCIHVGGDEAPCSQIVGVAAQHLQSELREDPVMSVWVPIGSAAIRGVSGVAVRTLGPAAEQVAAIRAEVTGLDPSIRYVDLMPMASEIGAEARSWKLGATLFGAFGLLAVVVAGIGMYGLLAFDVARRRFELGIRRALGATEGTLVSRVIAQAIRSVVVGAGMGLLLAAFASPRLAPLLFDTSPRDPRVFAAAAAMLLAVCLVAAGLPAARASRADPMETLRAE